MGTDTPKTVLISDLIWRKYLGILVAALITEP
jgi:hypothetical protein